MLPASQNATIVYLALGSNLGDRRQSMQDAIARLGEAGVTVAARSPFYETDAVGCDARDPQPAYLNAVVRVETTRAPADLLALCLDIERALGRIRPPDRPKASRTLDIDVLLYGDRRLATPTLTVPHPALLDRPFVRIPLADVALPDLRHPLTGDDLTQALSSPTVRPWP
jgi:2-amino-4-hydroxy-6-hydroxymethyldihydropteridine diphosphokinase